MTTNKPDVVTIFEDETREEFEAWWKSEMNVEVMGLHRCAFPFTKYQYQPYACHETHRSWMAWQASRAALAPAAKPRLTGANGGEFKFVLKWDGADSHPYFEFHNGVFDMAGKNHISDLLIAVSNWISEYAESIRTSTTRTDLNEFIGVTRGSHD